MKSLIAKSLAGIFCLAATFAFSPKPGGEGFEIFLGPRLLTQQFGSKVSEVKIIRLNYADAKEDLVVKYYHCGQTGKHRVITIRDEKSNLLKEFRFADGNGTVQAMSVKVQDILNLKKGNDVQLKLYYASTELPGGRQLASLVTGNENRTAAK